MKIDKKDIKKRNPFWKEGAFKRVHKNKKKYNRKDKYNNNNSLKE